MNREDEDEALGRWCRSLMDGLALAPFEVDIEALLGLAGRAAHTVMRPAAPLTTFVVGYAAGRTAAAGDTPAEEAVADALAIAMRLTRDRAASEAPE